MALITCSECGKEISDKAETCINCGCPLKETIKVYFEKPPKVIIRYKCRLYVNDDLAWEGQQEESAVVGCKTKVHLKVKVSWGWRWDTASIDASPGEYFIVDSNAWGKTQIRRIDKDFATRKSSSTFDALWNR